ncbi:MAG: FtsQ-type POTRA domain-containing protein [Anaerovibrio sp.]|uniref:cell division protein FtsQ/DivIB n=1 Tax=Anaerovibrio sp. TaxID=1872532 RepID=UPI0025DA2BA8|nr:FtsQ-type POTRA domain-containing protein [Anaerovibrio sp.]MCR5175404.1 FtsQ-type POTRA domain-containing protein [Anaerovibrio sp.]
MEEGKVDTPKKKVISHKVLVTLMSVLILFLVVITIALSPVFVLKHVKVSGNYYISEEEVCRISGVNMGENLFQLKIDDIMQTMVKDIRIERAIVRRAFPSTLEIQVVERVPLAMIKCDYGFLELGRGGVILDAHRTLTDIPVPIISGVSVSSLFVGDTVENANINAVLNFLDKLHHETTGNISEINIADTDNVTIYMRGPVQLKLGNLDSIDSKQQITESVNKEIKQAKYPIDYIDARFDGSYSIKFKE